MLYEISHDLESDISIWTWNEKLKKKSSSVFSVSLISVKLASLIKEHSINFFKQKLVSCVNLVTTRQKKKKKQVNKHRGKYIQCSTNRREDQNNLPLVTSLCLAL